MAQVWPHQHHHHLQLRHHHHSSQGVLGKLGNPGKVLGVDISEEMINHCSNHYSGQENLSFQVFTWSDNQLVVVEIEDGFTISPQTLDVSNGADFCQTKESSFNMASRSSQPWHWSHQVTSFSCLHWVPNQPDAVSVFNRVLKPGGKFLFVVRNTVNLVNHVNFESIWSIIASHLDNLKNSRSPELTTLRTTCCGGSTRRCATKQNGPTRCDRQSHS